MNYPNLEKVLDELSDWFSSEYKQNLKDVKPHRNGHSYDSIATSTLYNSVNCEVVTTTLGYNVYFKAEDYWIYVESGRKAGKGVPPRIIDKWIIDRNIQPYNDISKKQLSYLINRSIKQHGIKAKPFFKQSYDEVEDKWYQKIIDALTIDLTNIMSDEITLKLNKITLKI